MEDFGSLFSGSTLSYGTWDLKRKPPALTIKEPVGPEQVLDHLLGKIGLGIVPVRVDGTCRFGALDIDIDTIDHQLLYSQVQNLNLPLHVCRSRSGAAHLYVFIQEPGIPAVRLRRQLAEWSKKLGYGGCEIFPKQDKIGSDNLGNWINLPYFGGDDTTRYCVGPAGPKTLDKFLSEIKFMAMNVPASGPGSPERGPVAEHNGLFKLLNGPPCMETIHSRGKVGWGKQNIVLFNMSIALKRANPTGYIKDLLAWNQENMDPPMPEKEVMDITKRKEYDFTCQETVLAEVCQYAECCRRPYGKGWSKHKEKTVIEENRERFTIKNLRKINTDPPSYLVEVMNKDVSLTADELFVWPKFKRRIVEQLDYIVVGFKQDRWEGIIQDLLNERTDIDAPADASRTGLIWDRVREYLSRYKRARSLEDVLKEMPYYDKEKNLVLFRAAGLFKYLSQYRLDQDSQTTFAILRQSGGSHRTVRVKNKVVAVWSIPFEELREENIEFTPPEMPPPMGEIL